MNPIGTITRQKCKQWKHAFLLYMQPCCTTWGRHVLGKRNSQQRCGYLLSLLNNSFGETRGHESRRDSSRHHKNRTSRGNRYQVTASLESNWAKSSLDFWLRLMQQKLSLRARWPSASSFQVLAVTIDAGNEKHPALTSYSFCAQQIWSIPERSKQWNQYGSETRPTSLT